MSFVLALGFIAALALLYAASKWLTVSRRIDARAGDEKPTLPVSHVQSAAVATATALGMSAFVLIAAWVNWQF